MSEQEEWAFPPEFQPDASSARFDLEQALSAVVALEAEIPPDAFTAKILGTERGGSAVVIREDGLALTIGYLVTEAVNVRLTTREGVAVDAHPIAVDFPSGFGLVQPLAPLRVPPLPRGKASALGAGDPVTAISHGGRTHALAARVVAKAEFAGYWEYLLDVALFTAPPHPEWSGAALVDEHGRLVGIGSLFVQEAQGEDVQKGNMFVPIDVLVPILDDLVARGRAARPARPWLGMYAGDDNNRLVVGGLAPGGPADRAGVRQGDLVVAVADQRVATLAEMLRSVWKLGPSGTVIPLTLARNGATVNVKVKSADRGDFMKKPSLQ